MPPLDPVPPSDTDIARLGPWGAVLAQPDAPDLPSETQAPPPPPQPSTASQFGWALVSTALLAAWLGWQWGWVYAAAGVLGVFVHEFGHLAAINGLGCGPGRIHIIPMFGGAASMSRAPDTEFKGVLIALAGPTLGLLAAVPFFALFVLRHDPIWLQGVLFIGGLNLLNLAPAPPLDGAKALGPVLAWIHPLVERGAMILIGAAGVFWALTHGQVLIAVVIGLGVAQAVMGRAPRPPARRLGFGEWLCAMGLWVMALGLCAGVTWVGLVGANIHV